MAHFQNLVELCHVRHEPPIHVFSGCLLRKPEYEMRSLPYDTYQKYTEAVGRVPARAHISRNNSHREIHFNWLLTPIWKNTL